MNKKDYLNVRVNKDIKDQAETILDRLNLNLSQAINLFLNQIIIEKGIPFDVRIPKYEEAYLALDKAIKFNSFGGGVPTEYTKTILLLYAKGTIDFETAVFALGREVV